MIEVTGIDLKQFAKDVYDLSVPQGLGFLRFEKGGLQDDVAEKLVFREPLYPLNMDYVHGRACKMTVRKDGEKLFIDNTWYDHTDDQFKELLSRHNIQIEKTRNHGFSCACSDCKAKRLSG